MTPFSSPRHCPRHPLSRSRIGAGHRPVRRRVAGERQQWRLERLPACALPALPPAPTTTRSPALYVLYPVFGWGFVLSLCALTLRTV